MNILLLGSGGREHCLAWKLSQSPHCSKLYIAPGNGGTAQSGTNVEVDPNDFEAVAEFITAREIHMLVVGPEDPLVNGICDHLRAQPKLADLMIIGPDKKGAMLEGSKAYAKQFMEHYGIPTAAYSEYDAASAEKAISYLDTCDMPIVIKADGLAAGKGVVICQTKEEAENEVKAMLDGKFGEASSQIVIEDFLAGREFSVFVLTDGQSYKILPIAKDYKRVGEGDEGPNTGGMGSVSPVSFVSEQIMEKVRSRIIEPTINGISESGYKYQGIIFFGLMEVSGNPYVIEYNCRLGDPETQVVLPRIESDLVELFRMTCKGELGSAQVEISEKSAATVILVSGGYPKAYEKGKHISGLDKVSDSMIFQAGTRHENGSLVTNGGRVLAVTSLEDSVEEALKVSYRSIGHISFDKQYYRRDIGFDV